ncbi:hypothetical protein F5Y17DRAFT_272501 [Xylariaceae sp. FL0594]|nr:hypothetical protein F5Y17DRAFT_272501 [Xylariaceae sp. FL0594]
MPLQIPHPKATIHLYRHLLRESTYLPQLCRPWIAFRIRDGFEAYRHKRHATPYIKEAHAYLRYLRSANAGHVGRLERLCFMATGRVGKRRHTLIEEHLSKPAIADTAELKAALQTEPAALYGTVPTAAHDWLENWSIDKLLALGRSQLEAQTSLWPHTLAKGLIDPAKTLQKTNCFNHPPGRRLARNRLKKHFRSLLDQVMAPLPEGEWHHLQTLVLGSSRDPQLRIPRRRPIAQPVQEDSNSDPANEEWDWTQHVLYPARKIERGNSRKMKSLTGKEDQDPRGHGRPIGIRFISPTVLKRIYRRAWEMSPLMKKNPGDKDWTVVWGYKPKKLSAPTTGELAFFSGVGEDGRFPLSGKKRFPSSGKKTKGRGPRVPEMKSASLGSIHT